MQVIIYESTMKPFSFLTLLHLLQVSFVEILFIRAYRTIRERTSENYDSACKQFVYTLQHSGYIYNGKITNDNRILIIDFIPPERYILLSVVCSSRRNHAHLYTYAHDRVRVPTWISI